MHRLLRWSPLLVLPVIALGFFQTPAKDPVVIPSTFRWKNNYWLESGEQQAITRNGIQRVYHKLLDIDWNPANGAHPVSVVRIPYQWRSYNDHDGYWSDKVELVPCIYITNNTFLRIGDKEVDQLARNLLRKLRLELPDKVHGVLLDCDWTAKTKDRFFRLTRIMNDSLDVPLSATIRLHQYANPKGTGVPPADRGMLMPYNVGQITAPGDGNSIFDLSVAEPYFTSTKPYPLPLDIGLPAFAWGVQFRNGAFVGVLQDQQVQDALSLGLLSGEANGTLQVTQENNEHMPELHLGDVVRVERMTPEVIAQVAQLARTAVNSDTLAVAYFELGTGTFQKMTKAEVNAGFQLFGPLRKGSYSFDDEGDGIAHPVRTDTAAAVPANSALWEPVDTAVPVIEPHHIKRP
ncbi:MAG: hypothetical protein JNL52_05105 [Flavobacteriales bacterium]|nr:hypothetical protein [Flavobacteriales bacterium]